MRSSTLVVVLVATLTRAQEDEVALYYMEPDAWPGAETDDFGLPAFRERKIKVQHLSPSFGRDAGGLLVNVTGKGFVVATDPKCQFGGEDTMIVNATVKSANFIQCWSPPNAETDGGIPWTRSYDIYSRVVEVSLNGVDWTTSSKPFTYYGAACRSPVINRGPPNSPHVCLPACRRSFEADGLVGRAAGRSYCGRH